MISGRKPWRYGGMLLYRPLVGGKIYITKDGAAWGQADTKNEAQDLIRAHNIAEDRLA